MDLSSRNWKLLCVLAAAIALVSFAIDAVAAEAALAVGLLVAYVVIDAVWSKRRKTVFFDVMNVFTGDEHFDVANQEERQGMRELVDRLKKNHQVVALTNLNPEIMDFYDKKLGLSKLFDKVVYSGAVGVRKPDAGIYAAALAEAREKPENAVFVDDVAANVEGARAVGMRGIHFRSLDQLAAELSAAGVAV